MSCSEGQNRQIIIYNNDDTVSLLLIPRVHLTDYTFIPLGKGPTFFGKVSIRTHQILIEGTVGLNGCVVSVFDEFGIRQKKNNFSYK